MLGFMWSNKAFKSFQDFIINSGQQDAEKCKRYFIYYAAYTNLQPGIVSLKKVLFICFGDYFILESKSELSNFGGEGYFTQGRI